MAEVKRDVMRHGEWDEERQRYSDGSERHRCTPKECIKLLEAIYPPYEPEEPTDIYKVMIECHDLCESWEASREMHRTSDPVEAIDRSALMRDDFHITWVERVNPSESSVEPDKKPKWVTDVQEILEHIKNMSPDDRMATRYISARLENLLRNE